MFKILSQYYNHRWYIERGIFPKKLSENNVCNAAAAYTIVLLYYRLKNKCFLLKEYLQSAALQGIISKWEKEKNIYNNDHRRPVIEEPDVNFLRDLCFFSSVNAWLTVLILR